MWQIAKSTLVALTITILIWLAADQNVMESEPFEIPIRLKSEDANRYAGLAAAPYQATFNVTLRGRRKNLKDFRDLLNAKGALESFTDASVEPSAEPQLISSRDLLSGVKQIAEQGLEITSCEPTSTSVLIDNYETVHDIKVSPDYGDLKVSAEPSPDTVSVRLPRFAGIRLKADPVARAEVQSRILAARQPDNSFRVKVPLTLPALRDMDPDMRVKILPSEEVIVTGQIASLTEARRKGPIQITWSIPQDVQERFTVVPDRGVNFRPDIDVIGPRGLIEQLDPKEIRAFVDVLAADMEKPRITIRRNVQFVLPPGFALTADSQPYEVAFQLEPRSTVPAAD